MDQAGEVRKVLLPGLPGLGRSCVSTGLQKREKPPVISDGGLLVMIIVKRFVFLADLAVPYSPKS